MRFLTSRILRVLRLVKAVHPLYMLALGIAEARFGPNNVLLCCMAMQLTKMVKQSGLDSSRRDVELPVAFCFTVGPATRGQRVHHTGWLEGAAFVAPLPISP